MTNIERMPKSEVRMERLQVLSRRFGFRDSGFVRHWSFVIRISRRRPALAEPLRPRLRQLWILAPAQLERRALHNFQYQSGEFVTAFSQALRDLVHGALVVVLEAAAQRIGQHFFG